MGVPADDDVGAGVDELLRELLLPGQRAGVALLAPVEVDDDRVGVGAGPADLLDEPVGPLGRGHAGLVALRGPGVDELPVEHLRGAEHGDALALHLDDVRRVGRVLVLAEPDERQPGRPGRGQRVGQALAAEVEPVVVGQADDVDPGVLRAPAASTRGRGRRTACRPAVPRSVTAVSRLTTVTSARAERVADARQPGRDGVAGRALGVHVTGEGERHRLRLDGAGGAGSSRRGEGGAAAGASSARRQDGGVEACGGGTVLVGQRGPGRRGQHRQRGGDDGGGRGAAAVTPQRRCAGAGRRGRGGRGGAGGGRTRSRSSLTHPSSVAQTAAAVGDLRYESGHTRPEADRRLRRRLVPSGPGGMARPDQGTGPSWWRRSVTSGGLAPRPGHDA